MTLATRIRLILDGDRSAMFARGGGARSAKGGKAGDKAKKGKGKGVATAGKGGACCKGEGGKFAPGNNYGSLNRGSAKVAANKAGRVAAKAVAAAATPKSGPFGSFLTRSKQASAKGAAIKAARDKEAAVQAQKEARNAKAREARAAKKEAQKAQRAVADKQMVARSKAAVVKGALAKARAKQKADIARTAGTGKASDADRAALARVRAENAARRAAASKPADTRSQAERWRAAGIQVQSTGTGKGTFKPAGPLPTPKTKAAGRGTPERSEKAAQLRAARAAKQAAPTNDYQARKAARIERYRSYAASAKARAERAFGTSNQIADRIPMGQPILVGHHSERRHRRDMDRIHSAMDRSVAESKKSAYWERRASSVESSKAISSKDPEALTQIRAKIADLESKQARRKLVNEAHKKFLKDPASLDKTSLSESEKAIIRGYKPTFSGDRHPFPSSTMTNASANIRRMKERAAEIEKQSAPAPGADRAAADRLMIARSRAAVAKGAASPAARTYAEARAAGYGPAEARALGRAAGARAQAAAASRPPTPGGMRAFESPRREEAARSAAAKAAAAKAAPPRAAGRGTPERSAKAGLIRAQRTRVQQAKAEAARMKARLDAMPARTADTMSEAIALSSPSGRMSKRARDAANKRTNEKLFGPGGLPGPSAAQPSGPGQLRRQAGELRSLAARGMKPRAYAKKADQLEAAAAAMEKPAASRPAAPVAPPPASIERRPISDPVRLRAEVQTMDRAFEKAPGSRDNFVTLDALHKTMPHLSRDEFVRVVNEGRDAGKYTLDSAEGRVKAPPGAKEAGLREGGSLLVYIRRRDR